MKIIIPGWLPVPKGRARSTRAGGHYTPARTRKAELLVWQHAILAMAGRQREDVLALELSVAFFFPIPAKTRKADRPFMVGCPHVGRPDLDNLLKLVKDALNGLVYRDDSQIARIYASKSYDYEPGCIIEVTHYDL